MHSHSACYVISRMIGGAWGHGSILGLSFIRWEFARWDLGCRKGDPEESEGISGGWKGRFLFYDLGDGKGEGLYF